MAFEREQYWIQFYDTFKNGYNATKGGDGKPYVDYNTIYLLWQKGLTIKDIKSKLGHDQQTIRVALKQFCVSHKEIALRAKKVTQKQVAMLDKKTQQTIKIFPSIAEAYLFLKKQHSGHIAEVCCGKRKSAYRYKWKYI